jgi:hypothetical protein
MISWLIGIATGVIYDFIGIAARLKPEDEARKLTARWALSPSSPSKLLMARQARKMGIRIAIGATPSSLVARVAATARPSYCYWLIAPLAATVNA